VVATGLGAKIEKPVKVIDNTVQVTTSSASSAATPASRGEQSVNYKDYERPTVQRQSHGGAAAAAKLNPQDDLDYLDIPAFLRRQAD
jgi:cell division protein FtsZ